LKSVYLELDQFRVVEMPKWLFRHICSRRKTTMQPRKRRSYYLSSVPLQVLNIRGFSLSDTLTARSTLLKKLHEYVLMPHLKLCMLEALVRPK
jgi:hypothetical protein